MIPCGHVRAFASHPLTRGVVRVLFAAASILLPSIAAAQGSQAPHEPLEALAIARAIGSPVVVAGSLYLAGEIRAKLT